MGYWNEFPEYVSVGEKRAKAERKLEKLRKKNPDIRPVLIEGTTIARTWWGKSWNSNLERYADYSNRIGRGRSYVRHRAVLDLQISEGRVDALVQGSHSMPYSVAIKINATGKKNWESIKKACEGRMDSLPELLAGKFPKELKEVFMTEGKGLFPTPAEIKFSCSCPDWAYMCKHVAAALYGVGARLDEEPGLFFKLRKVDVSELIKQTVNDKTRKLLQKAKKKTSRIIDDSNLSEIFGIEMDDVKKSEQGKVKPKRKAGTAAASAKSAKKNSAGRNAQKQKAKEKSTVDIVVEIIRRSKKGVTVGDIKKKTVLDDSQIRSAVLLGKRHGKIKSRERGVYVKN